MKVIPLNGYCLVERLKRNFEIAGSKDKPIYIPQTGSGTSFFNRGRILEVDTMRTVGFEDDTDSPLVRTIHLQPGDVVILSSVAAGLAVPGQVKNENGRWVDVILIPVDQIVGKIEGDVAETEEVVSSPIIMSSSNQPS